MSIDWRSVAADAARGRGSGVVELESGAPGYCYLGFADFDAREQLWQSVGRFPSLRALLLSDRRLFLSDERLDGFSLVDYGHVLHVVRAVGGNLRSFLKSAALGRQWPVGSLGAALGACGPVGSGQDRVLSTAVGATPVVPIYPVVMDRESVNAYNRAVVAYYDFESRQSAGAPVQGRDVPVSDSQGFVGMPRGPNYERNQAARIRKKVQREERRLAEAEARGRREACSHGVARGGDDAELHGLKVQRQIIQEKRKLRKLQSPEQIVEDAMRHVAIAARCAKAASNSKVAGWAATISTAYSESIAKSAPSSVPSLASVTSAENARVAKVKSFTIGAMPCNAVEDAAVRARLMTHTQVVEARGKAGRALVRDDFFREGAPAMNWNQRAAIQEAHSAMSSSCDDY